MAMHTSSMVSKALLLAWGLLCLPQLWAQSGADPETSELYSRIDAYQEAIAELDGSYGESSRELYLSLAQAQRAVGNLEDARFAYREAVQSIRINEGLAAESQLPLLQEFNGLLFTLQDWEQLDANMHMVEDVSRRVFGKSDERYVAAATALANWKILAYQTHAYRPLEDSTVQDAAEIYRLLLAGLPQTPENLDRRARYLSAKGLAHFYSAQFTAGVPVEEFRHAVPATGGYQPCMPVLLSIDRSAQPSTSACNTNPTDPEYYAAQQREKNNTVRRHLSNMRQSFIEAIVAIENNPDSSPRQLAIATLNLGDANLLAEDISRARVQYRRAWDMLSQDNESGVLRDELMGKASKALVGILNEIPGDPRIRGEGGPLGTVSFDVTATGEIINIDIQGPAEALTRENIGAIAMRLDQSVYRPGLVDGRPVQSRVTLPAAEL
ncbi:MAG: hypothetical protein RL120_00310 [Gammaproteobacteria bacterium]